jgi:hypothetical protein
MDEEYANGNRVYACLLRDNTGIYFMGRIVRIIGDDRHVQLKMFTKISYEGYQYHHGNDCTLAQDEELRIFSRDVYLRRVGGTNCLFSPSTNLYTMRFEPENWANHVGRLMEIVPRNFIPIDLIGLLISQVFINELPGAEHVICDGQIIGYNNATSLFTVLFTDREITSYHWDDLVSLIDYRDRLSM